MRQIVLGVILIWCFCAAEAVFDDDGIKYSNVDGIYSDTHSPLSLHRNTVNYTKTRNLKNQNYNAHTWNTSSDRKLSWIFIIEKNYPELFQNRRTFLKRDGTVLHHGLLEKLQETLTPEETTDCAEGPAKIMDCNVCVCLGGQHYLCSAKRCRATDGPKALKNYHETQEDECIEGEQIKSFDCNRCWCSGNKIICTRKKCSKGVELPDEQCIPGKYIASPDNCNKCGCNRNGERYCTVGTCGINPKFLANKDIGCVSQTWYSLYDSQACKECYCIDGMMSFCFLKLCFASRALSTGYNPLKMMPSIKMSMCSKGAVMFDECSKCICTYKKQWKCYTRMIAKCSAKEKATTSPPPVATTPEYNANEIPEEIENQAIGDNESIENPNNLNDNDDGKPTMARECIPGELFTLGSYTNCQGCSCSAQGQWQCYSIAKACRGYHWHRCWPGEIKKNPDVPCSTCYCGSGGEYICATDEKCSQQIQQSECVSLNCEKSCKQNSNWSGFCHQDKCICV